MRMKKVRKQTEKLKCCGPCGEEKEISRHFYNSYSNLYPNEKIPVCKSCLLERYKILVGLYKGNELLALKHFCMNFDIYYDEEFAKSLKGTREPLMVIYMKKIGSNYKKYQGKTSLNSLFKLKVVDEDDEEEIPITSKIRLRWGAGYTDDEYRVLERHYKEYDDYYSPDDLSTKQLFEELCTIRMIGDKARMNGDNSTFEKMSKLVSTKMQDADIKPNQKKKFGEQQGETFGTKMLIYEKTKPVICKLEEYKDVDGFGKYITKYLIKPFAKFWGLASGEYSIDGGDSEIQLNEDFEQEINKEVDSNEN